MTKIYRSAINKKLRIISICITLLPLFATNALANRSKRFVDLTHSFSSQTIYWPTGNRFRLKNRFADFTRQGYFYAVNDYEGSEHVGTHMDAPLHFAKGHKGVAAIPLDQLIGSAIVVDVRKQAHENRDYQIRVKDFLAWERKHGRIPAGTIILLNTGYSRYWPNRYKYMGTSKLGLPGIANLHFPGLSPKAAQWLVKKREIKAVGIDTASIDYGQSKQYMTHRILTKYNIPFFENVANLTRLPVKNFTVYALPMMIKEGTGAPLRIIARK